MTRSARTVRTTGATGPHGSRAVALALAAAALLALAVTGCGSKAASTSVPAEKPVAVTYPVTITDDASRTVIVKAKPQRIVSLAPAATEIAFALGLGEKVVGVTTFDDYPAEVGTIAKVGDFAGPNVEAVAATKPELILATSGVQADVVKKLEELGATVVVLDPKNLSGVYKNITDVGAITGSSAAAAKLVAEMKDGVAAVGRAVEGSAPVSAFVEISQNPVYTAGKGTFIDELVTLAGGTNVVNQDGYVAYSSEQLLKDDPQVYMATKGSMSDPAELAKRAGFSQLSAVKNGRVYILDDNLVSRPGPRLVLGLKQIAAALHPDSAPSGQ